MKGLRMPEIRAHRVVDKTNRLFAFRRMTGRAGSISLEGFSVFVAISSPETS